MLPPATAAGDGYALQAHLRPARGVGGDLYDHFVADGRLFFLVGDVSGKGVPAALFMARTKALFGTIAARRSAPGRILAELNHALCAENDAGMFVTVVCGALDPVTGALVCASGGHDPPLLVRADGTLRTPPIEGGSLLGLIDGGEFPETRLQLGPGEALVAFSDGVSEALDPAGQLFTIERLAAALEGRPHASAKEVCDTVLAAVEAFVAGAPQSDDLTLLVLRRAEAAAAPAVGPTEVRIEVAPRLDAIPEALSRLTAWLEAAGVPAAPAADLRLVSEELLSNAVRHGGARSPILLLAAREAALVRLELWDDGVAFDPLDARAPAERAAGEPGGWGLALVRELMDEAVYAREGDRNVVRLGRRLDS
jgi:sigma-B regulation protein RsbU (phosphoserine phosphatase)